MKEFGLRFILLIVLNIICVFTQDIGFPEEEISPEFQNKDNRQPIYIPGRCPQNELLYPGDQKDDWICDCAPGFLYYPLRDLCYPAYKQGPCKEREYLILESGSSIPKCAPNKCNRNGYVFFENMCYQLGKIGGPCGFVNSGGGVLGINGTTYAIECLPVGTEPKLNSFNGPFTICPSGSRRNYSGKCPRSV